MPGDEELQIRGRLVRSLGALAKRIGPLSEDTAGYALERQNSEPVFALGGHVGRRLIQQERGPQRRRPALLALFITRQKL